MGGIIGLEIFCTDTEEVMDLGTTYEISEVSTNGLDLDLDLDLEWCQIRLNSTST